MENQENKQPEDKKLPNDGRPYIVAAVNEDGSLKVTGTIDNKVLAYGILETAKDAIHDHISKQVKIEHVNMSGGLINRIRNGFK